MEDKMAIPFIGGAILGGAAVAAIDRSPRHDEWGRVYYRYYPESPEMVNNNYPAIMNDRGRGEIGYRGQQNRRSLSRSPDRARDGQGRFISGNGSGNGSGNRSGSHPQRRSQNGSGNRSRGSSQERKKSPGRGASR